MQSEDVHVEGWVVDIVNDLFEKCGFDSRLPQYSRLIDMQMLEWKMLFVSQGLAGDMFKAKMLRSEFIMSRTIRRAAEILPEFRKFLKETANSSASKGDDGRKGDGPRHKGPPCETCQDGWGCLYLEKMVPGVGIVYIQDENDMRNLDDRNLIRVESWKLEDREEIAQTIMIVPFTYHSGTRYYFDRSKLRPEPLSIQQVREIFAKNIPHLAKCKLQDARHRKCPHCADAETYRDHPLPTEKELRELMEVRRGEPERMAEWFMERGIKFKGPWHEFTKSFREWFEKFGGADSFITNVGTRARQRGQNRAETARPAPDKGEKVKSTVRAKQAPTGEAGWACGAEVEKVVELPTVLTAPAGDLLVAGDIDLVAVEDNTGGQSDCDFDY